MAKRKFAGLLHLTWLIPGLLLILLIQQILVFYGIRTTFAEGEHHTAYVTDFRIKQIAAQTNGYVDLAFTDNAGNNVEERLSLHVQHAARLIGANEVEIRYRPEATYDIVIVSTYRYHLNTVRINLAVIGLSFIVMFFVALFASRYANRKKREATPDTPELEFVKA